MRPALCALILVVSFASHGYSLVYVQKDGLLIYYPVDEGVIAERLVNKYPAMLAFLQQRGLEFKFPLHVILDDTFS